MNQSISDLYGDNPVTVLDGTELSEIVDSAGDSGAVLESVRKDFILAGLPKQLCVSLTQSGSGDPTATNHFTSLGGTVVWTRSSTGTYVGTLAGAFLSGKVPKLEGFIANGSSAATINKYTLQRVSDNTIALGTYSNGTLTDSLLSAQYFMIPVFY